MTEFGLAQHHAGEEGAQRERHAEQFGGSVGDADGGGDHAEGKQFARTGARHLPQNPREQLAAHHQHEDDETGYLPQRHGQGLPQAGGLGIRRDLATEHTGERRQQHQHQYRDEIFHHQPADGDAAIERVEDAPFFQRAQQHHGTGHGQGQAKDQSATEGPAPPVGQAHAHRRGDADLQDGAGQRNLAHVPQIVDGKVQADTKHHQHHPDLRQLPGYFRIRHKTGRGRSDDDAGGQIADQCRQFQARGDEAEDEAEPEGGGDGGDQTDVMGHAWWVPYGDVRMEKEGVQRLSINATKLRLEFSCRFFYKKFALYLRPAGTEHMPSTAICA